MGLMFLMQSEVLWAMWMLLVGVMGLTFWECRERGYRRKVTIWWMLFVFTLAHVIGYLILRFAVKPPAEPAD